MATSRYILQQNNTKNHWLIPLLVVFFTVMGAAFAFFGYEAGQYFTMAVLLMGALLNVDDSLCLILFCLPFTSLLKLSATTISVLPFLYLLFLLKILAGGKSNVSPMAMFGFLAFTIFQCVSMLLYDAPYADVLSTALNVAFVMFTAGHYSKVAPRDPKLMTTAALSFGFGVTLDLLLCDFFPDLPQQVDAIKQAELAAANRYAATVMDPNDLAQIILIAIGLLIAILPSIESRLDRCFILLMLLYIGISGIRTNSKSYAIAIVLLIVFLMVMYLRIVSKREGSGVAWQRFVPILLLALVGFGVAFFTIILPVFESRSSENVDLLTKRTYIWNTYINALQRRADVLFLGCGGGNVTAVTTLAGMETSDVPHNAYLEYLIQFGVAGLTSLALAWSGIFKVIKQKMNTYFSLPLAAFLITAFGISVNANDCLFVLLALLSLPLPPNTDRKIVQKVGKRRVSKYIKASETRV